MDKFLEHEMSAPDEGTNHRFELVMGIQDYLRQLGMRMLSVGITPAQFTIICLQLDGGWPELEHVIRSQCGGIPTESNHMLIATVNASPATIAWFNQLIPGSDSVFSRQLPLDKFKVVAINSDGVTLIAVDIGVHQFGTA
jgi:hypothetical protein